MSESAAGFFATPGPTTALGPFVDQVASLPDAPAELGEVVRGLLLHDWTAATTGIEISPERDGVRTFGAAPTLRRVLDLDGRPLAEPRPPAERLIGFCYHFALVHCALLRAKGVPARARCGFANYLIPGKWTDHWVTELWHDDEWRLMDTQIGLDELAHDDFRNGVQAWASCRDDETDAFDHGNGDLWGWDELRGSLVNDLGSLNKVEIGDWEWCNFLQVEPRDQPHPSVDAHLDGLAALASRDRPLSELRAAFAADDLIRPPDHVVEAASS